MEKHPTEWENISENLIPDKGLIWKIYKEHRELSSKTRINRINIRGATLFFSKDDIDEANKFMKKCSSLIR